MDAFTGKVARVDLTAGQCRYESTDSLAELFVGGRGINSWILLSELRVGGDPLGPENVIVFGAGPLVATEAPSACFVSIGAKNVLTGGINYSHAGGHFAAGMKGAGFDHLVLEGRADKPVYLYLHEGTVEIMDARRLWGKTTWDAQVEIRAELGRDDLRFAMVGPAGENLVKFAIIVVDKTRAAGSGGIGAVMGSKNVKGIVTQGATPVELADPERFRRLAAEAWKRIGTSEYAGLIRYRGTHGLYSKFMNEHGSLPTRNIGDDHWDPDKMARIDLPAILEGRTDVVKLDERFVSCPSCPIQCGYQMYEVVRGPYEGLKLNGFEANTVFAFGSRCDIDDMGALVKIFEQLSTLGLDNDAAGVVISWAIDCFERGILTLADTKGIPLHWGDSRTVIALLGMIAHREGLGDLLAEGVMRASEKIGRGSEALAIHCKGQDNVDALRAAKGWGLGNVVSLRGGRHLDGAPTTEYQAIPRGLGEKLYGVPDAGDQAAYSGKGRLTCWYTHFKAFVDSLGLCYYTTLWGDHSLLGPEEISELYSSATGRIITPSELLLLGRRIINIEKAFNTLHRGFSRKDDMPPGVFMREAVKTGAYKGELLDEDKWNEMLDEFYQCQNWDKATGLQTKECLDEVGLTGIYPRLVGLLNIE